jgi:FtsP/CotA-like multicopper oxidase with cupredoxin domain
MNPTSRSAALALLLCLAAAGAQAQSFRVQCPATTALHPNGSAIDPLHPGQVKCQHIGGGDGYATMADGNQIYLFAFSPLSGLASLEKGKPGTQLADDFNPDAQGVGYRGPNYSLAAGYCQGGANTGQGCRVVSECPDSGAGTSCVHSAPNWSDTPNDRAITEPAGIMDMGVLAGNAPAPLMAIDEDDEFFLTLSNPGMIMRPDLFEQHTVHFHGYPNASSFFDGVPDASIAINIAGSFTYYYTAPDAGTYFWHCHITPPEHLQMGMVGQLYVRPRQNRVTRGATATSLDLRNALVAANGNQANNPGANGATCSDILCTGQTPAPTLTTQTLPAAFAADTLFAYNDGDGSTRYDVEFPLQMMGFDPNFHYVGMTFNPEAFADMKDKYFLLSGRGYPDTVNPNPISTISADGYPRPSQPLPALIEIDKTAGKSRALLRLSMLSVTEHVTLATVGVPMRVIAQHARLLRDMAGADTTFLTNSITMGGGESTDVILDVSDPQYQPGQTFFLYSTNLDHLSNDAENFGGMMTEIRIK